MSYDKGTFDVFINGKLVASRPEIVPYIQLDNVVTGEDDGISGGICNVVYYSGRLSQSRIQTYYDLLKDREPPVVYPIPFSNFFSNKFYINWPIVNFYYLGWITFFMS